MNIFPVGRNSVDQAFQIGAGLRDHLQQETSLAKQAVTFQYLRRVLCKAPDEFAAFALCRNSHKGKQTPAQSVIIDPRSEACHNADFLKLADARGDGRRGML